MTIGDQAGRALTLLSGIVTCRPAGSAEEGFWPGLLTRAVFDLDQSGNEAGARLVADLLAEMWDRLMPPMTPAEEYELASRRFERAGERLTTTRKAGELDVLAAEAEYTAARRALERFEVTPGIPRPEYDPLHAGPAGSRKGDEEVLLALVRLWRESGWVRLEAYRPGNVYLGYCVTEKEQSIEIADVIGTPECPGVITDVVRLLEESGWTRLEIVGHQDACRAGGWCERGDGSGLSFSYPGPDGRPAKDRRPS